MGDDLFIGLSQLKVLPDRPHAIITLVCMNDEHSCVKMFTLGREGIK